MKYITPYNSTEKKKYQIIKMFNNISKNYDILNNILSFGMHKLWRKKAIIKIKHSPKKILDIATGTADFAISAAKYTNANITGVDISKKMLEEAKKKITKKKLNHRINLKLGDSEALPFKEKSFDTITAGFGVRNFENLEKGLKEMYRVLENNGTIIILEPSIASIFPLKQFYNIYFNHILPFIGGLISKDKNAYNYLSKSVNSFPTQDKFINKLKNTGFKQTKIIPLTFGIVALYTAIK